MADSDAKDLKVADSPPLKNKGGRPKKIKKPGPKPKPAVNPELEGKLLLAYAFDCTDEQACLFAEISVVTLWRYKKKNPEFVKRINLQRQTPVLKARKAVIDSFATHPDIAFQYLKKKQADEFGDGNGGQTGREFVEFMLNAAAEIVSQQKSKRS